MIPRAVDQVFRVADDLKSKGWVYKMEGQFLEIVSLSVLFNRANIDALTSTTKLSMIFLAKENLIRRSMKSSTTLRRVLHE